MTATFSPPTFISGLLGGDDMLFADDAVGDGIPRPDLVPALDNTTNSDGETPTELNPFAITIIALIAIFLIVVTIVGNLLVLVSFGINRQLRSLTNYFLLSLAIADCCIGFISMPLYAVFVLMGYWPFGGIVCDLWLTFDYVLCNASVCNLLVICCDRYLSLTRPLTYRASRTPKKVFFMIASAWVLSIVAWSPWIFGWSYIEGGRTVPEDDCYIQFLEGKRMTSRFISLALTVVAFYGPVAAMCVLYFKVYGITRQRTNELKMLRADGCTDYQTRASRPSVAAPRERSSQASTVSNKRVSEAGPRQSEPPTKVVAPRLSHSMMAVQHVPREPCPKQILTKKTSLNSDSSRTRFIPAMRQVSLGTVEYCNSPTSPTSSDSPSFFNSSIFSAMRSIDSQSGEDESSSASDASSLTHSKLLKIDTKVEVSKSHSSHAVLSRLSFYLQEDRILRTMAPVISALRNGDVVSISGETPPASVAANEASSNTSLDSLKRVLPGRWMSFGSKASKQVPKAVPARVVFDDDSLEPVLLRQPPRLSSPLSQASSSNSSTHSKNRLLKQMSAGERRDNVRSPLLGKKSNFSSDYIMKTSDGTGSHIHLNSVNTQDDDIGTLGDDFFPENDTLRRQSMFAQFKEWSSKALTKRVELVRLASSSGHFRQSTTFTDNEAFGKSCQTGKGIKTKQVRRIHDDRAAERKAAKMLTAILLVFVLTWLPYNVLTNIETFCFGCVPTIMYQLSYCLCYINSTLNPICYAYCNATFRNTFIHILQCKYLSVTSCFGVKDKQKKPGVDFKIRSAPYRNSTAKTDSSLEIGTAVSTSRTSRPFRKGLSSGTESSSNKNRRPVQVRSTAT